MKRDKQDQDRRARNREELRVIMKVKEKWTVRDKGGRRLEHHGQSYHEGASCTRGRKE